MLFKKNTKNLSSEHELTRIEERNDPKRELRGLLKYTVLIIAIAMSLYHMYSTGFKMLPQAQHRPIHLGFALCLTFLLYPFSKQKKHHLIWLDIVIAVCSLFVTVYLVVQYLPLVARAGAPLPFDLVLGGFTILIVLEAARRTMGWGLVIVAVVALLYALLGHHIPGPLGHRRFKPGRVIEHMFLTSEGIYGVAIYVTATFVFMFILLGSFLNSTGGAKSFIDLAFSITGKYRGGPAKAAVVGSGLMGTISGSSFANVAGTGTFTIPLMKSVGYKPEFAGGVEAAASTGGQIMPPIMGAAAFIMAEMTGVPYGKLIGYAAIPAVLYYVAVFIMVDIEAAKMNLKGLSKENLPILYDVLKNGGFLLLAPASIIVILLMGFSAIKASFVAVCIVLIGSCFRKHTRLTPRTFLEALKNGALNSLGVIAACAVAGLIVGTVTLTGLGLKFGDLIVFLSAGNLYLALFLTMIACIIMSMGMPTTALYIILGTMIAPALVDMGVPIVAAHLFIFYYGCMATVTPPVALSSYLAASIAGANSLKTTLTGLKLALAAFILPVIFATSPEIIFLGGNVVLALKASVTALIGVVALAVFLENHLIMPLNWLLRSTAGIIALLLMIPGSITDVVGISGFVLILAYQFMNKKSHIKRINV